MNPNVLVGKTIKSVDYCDNQGDGIHIEFTDGTVLSINERSEYVPEENESYAMGEIQVIHDGEFLISQEDVK